MLFGPEADSVYSGQKYIIGKDISGTCRKQLTAPKHMNNEQLLWEIVTR